MSYSILVIFFILLSFLDIFIIKSKKEKFIILVLSFMTYLFFFGLRGFVGCDWETYYPNFLNSISLYEIFQNNQIKLNHENINFEIGFQVWLSFLKMFFSNWNLYLFFTTLIDIGALLFLFGRYSPYPIFSLLLFLGFNGFQFQLDLMRNLKSFLLFLFSIEYLHKNKNLKYFILNILNITFHRSSLVFIVIGYFLKKNFYKYKKIILFLFIFGVFFLIFSDRILYDFLKYILTFKTESFKESFEKLNFYLTSTFSKKRELGIGFVERIFTFILFYIYRKKIVKNAYGKIFYNIYLLYIFSYLYGSGVRIIFERVGLLFVCSYWIIYPILLKSMSKIKKILIFIFITIICLLKTYITFNYMPDKELYIYENIFFIQKSYEEKLKIMEKYKN